MPGRFGNMSRTRVRIDPDDPRTLPPGRVDHALLDATTEEDIALQEREDDAEAARVIGRPACKNAIRSD